MPLVGCTNVGFTDPDDDDSAGDDDDATGDDDDATGVAVRASTYGSSALEQDAVGVFTSDPALLGFKRLMCGVVGADDAASAELAEFCRAALHECMTREDAASLPRERISGPRADAPMFAVDAMPLIAPMWSMPNHLGMSAGAMAPLEPAATPVTRP